jgi:hypothetical protein
MTGVPNKTTFFSVVIIRLAFCAEAFERLPEGGPGGNTRRAHIA